MLTANYANLPIEELAVLVLSPETDSLLFGTRGHIVAGTEKPGAFVAYVLGRIETPEENPRYKVLDRTVMDAATDLPGVLAGPDPFAGAYGILATSSGKVTAVEIYDAGPKKYGARQGVYGSSKKDPRYGHGRTPHKSAAKVVADSIYARPEVLADSNFDIREVPGHMLGKDTLGTAELGTRKIRVKKEESPAGKFEIGLHEKVHQILGGGEELFVRQITAELLRNMGKPPIFHEQYLSSSGGYSTVPLVA
ncbi:MAG: hypothetical protein V1820_01615 [archaeon]